MTSDSEYVSCPACGMGWPTRTLCESCAFRPGGADPECMVCHGSGEGGLTPAHACPEPLPYEHARMMAAVAQAAGGIVVSPALKARIRLGLQQGPDA